MARIFRFRLWEKKRGERRTGSKLFGRVGEALFFGLLFLLGTASLSALITSQWVRPDPRFYEVGYGVYLMILVLASFILIGGSGFVFALLEAGASAERRSAMAKRAAGLDLISEALRTPKDFPNIPNDENLTNSPGIQLAYRLPSAHSPAWQLSVAGIFGLIWMGIASVLIVVVINSHRIEQPQWLLTIFVVPFSLIGLCFVYYFVRQLVIHTGIGPTNVEISDHPLFPDQRYQLYLTQAGRLAMTSLELWLICQEEATFHQGTDIRSESCVVFQQQIFRKENFQIDPGKPLEQHFPLQIPCNVMHSFRSNYNAVNWKLVVKGHAEGWPPFERSFPLIVYPAGNGEGSVSWNR